MYRPKHTGCFEVMGIEEVKAKFYIQSPAQVIDMLGLMGDSSDPITSATGSPEETLHAKDNKTIQAIDVYKRQRHTSPP